jgi:hypothetical protein
MFINIIIYSCVFILSHGTEKYKQFILFYINKTNIIKVFINYNLLTIISGQ